MISTSDTPGLHPLPGSPGALEGIPSVELPPSSSAGAASAAASVSANDATDEVALARSAWRVHVTRNRSIVADLFQGQQVWQYVDAGGGLACMIFATFG
jgi:hypothetical protein